MRIGLMHIAAPHCCIQRDQIIRVGNGIKDDCQKQIDEVTSKVKDQLRPLHDHLSVVWGMGQKLGLLQRHCAQLDQLLIQVAQERSLVLKSLSVSCLNALNFSRRYSHPSSPSLPHPPSITHLPSLHLFHPLPPPSLSLSLSLYLSISQSTPVRDTRQQKGTPTGAGGAAGTPPVVVSPPMGWPQPPPPTSPAGSYYTGPPPRQQGVELDSLRREKADLATRLNSKSQEVEKLNAELSTLKGQVRECEVCVANSNYQF